MWTENAGNNYLNGCESWLHQLYALDLTMETYVSKVAFLLYSIVPILLPHGSDDHHVMRERRDLHIITTAISAL